MLYFHPDPWGRWTNFDKNIFQRGGNHHLVGDLHIPFLHGSVENYPQMKGNDPIGDTPIFSLNHDYGRKG